MADQDPQLAAMAAAVRRLYVYHMRLGEEKRTGSRSYYGARPIPQWDGGRDRSGRTYKSAVWPKIAKIILAQGASLPDFVAAQFAFAPLDKPPRPNQFVTVEACTLYHSYLHDAGRDAARRLQVQHTQLALVTSQHARLFNCTLAEAARSALRDRMAAMSALYRYCVAVRTGENDIAVEFQDQAVEQYLSSPVGYQQGWGPLVPDGLIQIAARHMARLVGGVEDANTE